VVLYGCETWYLTLREEHGLRLFENRVLRRIFGPKRNEVMVGWRKLHNEELSDLYSSPSIVRMIKLRRMIWAGNVARMGRRGPRIGYWWKYHRERDHYEDKNRGGWIILRWNTVWVVWTGLVWLRIGPSGELL
jgi:hypothetical protein